MRVDHQAAGLVIFRTDSAGAHKYLLIQHTSGYWELPKGHIEPRETWQQTALREVLEETGITDMRIRPAFARKIRYLFRDRKKHLIHKTVYYGLAETRADSIRLSREHSGSIFLNFDSAVRQLTHATTRAIMRDAELFLGSSSSR